MVDKVDSHHSFRTERTSHGSGRKLDFLRLYWRPRTMLPQQNMTYTLGSFPPVLIYRRGCRATTTSISSIKPTTTSHRVHKLYAAPDLGVLRSPLRGVVVVKDLVVAVKLLCPGTLFPSNHGLICLSHTSHTTTFRNDCLFAFQEKQQNPQPQQPQQNAKKQFAQGNTLFGVS